MLLTTMTAQTMAHAPYTAPIQFWVEGGHTAILAGFAEKPFDSEVAIRGFEFQVVNPKHEVKALELSNVPSMSFASVETNIDGTYQILGQREAPIQYAKHNKKWMRVLDTKGAPVPALTERNYLTAAELTAKTEQISVTRFDEVLSYFTKTSISALQPLNDANLHIQYSIHPNLIKANQSLNLLVKTKGKAAQGFKIQIEKRLSQQTETVTEFETYTDQSGQAELTFPEAGQYIVTITSPDEDGKHKPQPETYRSIISLNIAP